jgi:hypothetical protein
VVAGNAVHGAAKSIRQKIRRTPPIISNARRAIVIENGRVAIAGVPERAIKAGRTRRARQFAVRAV